MKLLCYFEPLIIYYLIPIRHCKQCHHQHLHYHIGEGWPKYPIPLLVQFLHRHHHRYRGQTPNHLILGHPDQPAIQIVIFLADFSQNLRLILISTKYCKGLGSILYLKTDICLLYMFP